MSKTIKTLLKSARDKINQKDYPEALEYANQVVDLDPDNYNARIFLGVCYTKLNQFGKAEKEYEEAVKRDKGNLMGWQGLAQLYEISKDIDKLITTYNKLMEMYLESKEAAKFWEVTQKLMSLYEERSMKKEYIAFLQLLTPPNPYYQFLAQSSDLSPPVLTPLELYQKMIALQESYEQEYTKSEINARRYRLGSGGLVKVTADVEREVAMESKLPEMYEKLFEFGGDTMSENERTKIYKRYIGTVYKQLQFLDNDNEKTKLRENLFNICDTVIEKHLPVPLAYEIEIECTDAEWLDYPIELLSSYSKAIQTEEPQSSDQSNAFAKLIAGYLQYRKGGVSDDLANDISLTAEKLPDSVFANSFLVFVYLQLKDYESALTVTRKAVEVLNRYEKVTGIQLNKVRMSLQLFTAESYLHLDANQLSSALQIYKDTITPLVASKSISSPLYHRSLNGLAQTLLQLQKYPESLKAFTKVYELNPNVTAKSQIGLVHFCMKDYETAEITLKECIEELQSELKKEDGKVQEERILNNIKENLAECWFRLARVYWGQDGTRLSSALHTALISSAQLNPRYSPTFTYLGHYYRSTDDELRSLKCYQRAFSIDSGDEDAANWLVELYVKNGEEVKALDVLRKLVATERGAKSSWAWKALGFAEIKHTNFETAVTNFQTSLRLNVKKVASWEGLAESYLHLGKYMASVKAFTRVIELDPNNVLARYHMGTIYTKLGEFQKGVDAYADALKFLSPDTPNAESHRHWSLFQVPIMKGLGDCYLLYAKDCYAVGRYGMCGELLNNGIEIVHKTLKVQFDAGISRSSCLWKLLGDLFLTYRYVENWILKTFKATDVMNEIEQLENDRSALKELNLHDECVKKSQSKSPYFRILSVSRICYAFAILHSPALYGTYWYDAGMTYFFQQRCLNRQETLNSQEQTHDELLGMAIRCLKIALKLEPGNDIFWNALGVVLMVAKHPLLSQHCFVKAMEYNPKSAIAWANAGYLYLVQSDLELANQAFSMAQQLDPDWVLSWLGQAFIAELYGSHEASGLFAHSFELSGGMLVEANYKFAAYTFRETVSSKGRQAGEKQFITSIFAIRKFVEQSPSSASGHNLLGLLLERQKQYSESILHFRESLSILQSNLRKIPESSSEYNVIMKRISIVHNNLARVLCSLNDFPKSIESYRAVAHPNIYTYLGAGLSYYFNNELESSLKEFEKALSMVQEFEESDEKSKNVKNDVSLLLCQVLYALGSPQHIDLAKHQLLECVAITPHYLPALFGLCALGLVIDDGNLALAALRELLSVPADILGANDVDGDAEYLLSRFALLQSDFDSCKRFLCRAVHRNPSNPVLWSRLSEFLLRYRPSFADTPLITAESALTLIDKHQTVNNSSSNEIMPNILNIQSLSLLSVSDGSPRTGRKAFTMAQRFSRLFPSNLKSWSNITTCIRSQIAVVKFQSAKNKSAANEIDLLRVILDYTRQKANNNLRDQSNQHDPLVQVTVRRIFSHSSLALADALLLKSQIDIPSEQKLDLLKTAVRLCEGTITEAENDITKARGYLQLARILWGTGEFDNAIIAYKNALQLSPTLDITWTELATLYRAACRYDASEASLRLSIASLHNSPASQLFSVLHLYRHALLYKQDSTSNIPFESISQALKYIPESLASRFVRNLPLKIKLLQAIMFVKSGEKQQIQRAIKLIQNQVLPLLPSVEYDVKAEEDIKPGRNIAELDNETFRWAYYILACAAAEKGDMILAKESVELETKVQKIWLQENGCNVDNNPAISILIQRLKSF